MKNEDLPSLYNCVQENEDFIVQYNYKGKMISKIMIATNIASKIKNNEILLMAGNEGGKRK